jgi:hypothetical protein
MALVRTPLFLGESAGLSELQLGFSKVSPYSRIPTVFPYSRIPHRIPVFRAGAEKVGEGPVEFRTHR